MAEARNDRQNRRNEPPKTLGESHSDAGRKHCEPAHELDAVLNALAEPVIIYDALGAIRRVNRALIEFFGFDPTKENRETFRIRIKMLNRDGRAVTLDKLPSTRALRGEAVVGEPYSFVDAYGQRILAETSSVPIFSDGAVVGAVSILHNITEQQRAVEDARESRRQVIDILESISDGFLALDSLWRVTYVNKRAQELLNIGRIEVLFKSLWERLPNAQVLRLYKELNYAAETKTAASFDEFIPSLDKWFEFHIYPYEHGISVYFSDITERKRAEDALRESKERVRVKLERILSPEGDIGDLELGDIIDASALQSLVDDLYKLAKLPIGIIDLKGKVLVGTGWQDICTKFHRAHPETCKSCMESDLELTRGIPAGEFKLYKCKNGMWDAATPILVGGQHMGNLFWGQFFFEDEPIDHEFFRAQARRYGFDEEKYLAALESAPRISRQTLNVGMDFYLKFATMLSKLSYSNIGLARSLAERDALTASLRESRELMRAVITASPLPIFTLDRGGNVLMWNKAAERIFGWSDEEVLGRPLPIVPEDKLDEFHELRERVFRGESLAGMERRRRRKDGSLIDLSISTAPLYDAEGRVCSIMAVVADITERKQAKELSDALSGINAVITSTLDVERILHRVVVEAAEVIGCESAAIFMQENDFWTASYLYGFPQEFVGRRFSGDEVKAVDLVAKTGTLFVSNDAYNDARLNRKVMEQYTIRSTLVIPLMVKGEVLGTLSFYYRTTPKAFTEAQIDFANKLATSISLALGNARLYEAEVKAQAQARSELEISNFLLKAADALAMHVTLPEVLNSLADIIIEATQRGRVSISLIDNKTGELQLMALRGEPGIQIGTRLMLDKLVSGFKEELMKARPVILDFEAPDISEQARQFGASLNARNALLVPLVRAHNIIGMMGVDDPDGRATFNQREIEIVKGIAAQAVVAIENAKLYEAERNIADTLQGALITMPDRVDGIEFGHLYRSATEAAKVGGDFYDLFTLEHGKVGILIGDVAGKGLDAAALTSVVKNVVKAHAYEDSTPAMIISKTNDLVAKISSPGEFVTMVFCVLDTATGTLTYCSAGHPPAMIKRREGGIELLEKHSPIIGAFSGMHYRSHKAVLNKGDILVLYTDGLIEARCSRGFFGEESLVKLLANSGPVTAKELPRLLIDTVTECAGGKLADDTAILVVSLKSR